MKISWFSSGVSSAIATYLAIKKYPDLRVLYIDIDDAHPDSMRFLKDCECLFNKPITILKSKYKSVENVCLAFAYINGVRGAKCTEILKKRVRQQWEKENKPEAYIWGMDYGKRELARAERIKETMPDFKHEFPLIEEKINKAEAHAILNKLKIKRPLMYEKGYNNNNCIGCVKGGKGYWNKIRVDFPEIFEKRALLERRIGASCINGVYLDELLIGEGNLLKEILPECGAACELL